MRKGLTKLKTMDRYLEIKTNLIAYTKKDNETKAMIAIGSTTRSYSIADEYSDLDIIVATDTPEKWLYGNIPENFGDIMISFVEPTLGGGLERRILFNGSLDVDIIVFTPEQLISAVKTGIASEVMGRGYAVMYDAMEISLLLSEYIKPASSRISVSESEFNNLTQDFWFHIVWASKKILRGELWTAKMCIDAYLKNHLLRITEFKCSKCDGRDVWHNGRFFEKWADESTVKALEKCFARYNRIEIITALKNTAQLFSTNARATAELYCFDYPKRAEKYALSLISEYFPE